MGHQRQESKNAHHHKADGLSVLAVQSKNGGGGENRTRVQRSVEANIYKLSSEFPSHLLTGPLE